MQIKSSKNPPKFFFLLMKLTREMESFLFEVEGFLSGMKTFSVLTKSLPCYTIISIKMKKSSFSGLKVFFSGLKVFFSPAIIFT